MKDIFVQVGLNLPPPFLSRDPVIPVIRELVNLEEEEEYLYLTLNIHYSNTGHHGDQ